MLRNQAVYQFVVSLRIQIFTFFAKLLDVCFKLLNRLKVFLNTRFSSRFPVSRLVENLASVEITVNKLKMSEMARNFFISKLCSC